MASESHVKGSALERAVYLIQQSILESDPKFAGQEFRVDPNQTVTRDGVRHEIDVLVTTNPGTDYESRLIFECKNWTAPVGKNEIVILSEKVSVLPASRGFIVAASLTGDAEAQLRKDPRLRWVKVSPYFDSPLATAEFVHQMKELTNVRISARIVDSRTRAPCADPNLSIHQLWFHAGKLTTLAGHVAQLSDEFYARAFRREQTRLMLPGAHYGSAEGRVEFERGEFIRDGLEFEWLDLRGFYRVVTTPAPLRSKFELGGYGRTYFFEPLPTSTLGKQLEITIVERHPN